MKELTKAQKSGIVSWFTLNIIFLIIFLWSIFLYSYWEYNDIELEKNKLRNDIKEYNNILSKWITFNDFRRSSEFRNSESYYLNDVIDIDFFNLNFENTTDSTYRQFLDNKQAKTRELSESDIVSQRDLLISRVLPFYSEWVLTEWSITDLWFVNYIENLLRAFNLRTSDSIWITNLLVLWDDWVEANVLSSEIFYIPLELNLTWRRWDVLDFIYFMHNVWVVEEITEDDSVKFYSDNILNRRLNLPRSSQNLYENRIAEIVNIRFPDYLDAGLLPRGDRINNTTDFLNFIRNDQQQSSDEFSVSIRLNFYVRGLPSYELESFISSVLDKYDEIYWEIRRSLALTNNRKLSSSSRDLLLIENFLRDLDSYLKELEPRVNLLKWTWNQRSNNLEQNYRTALDLNVRLEGIDNVYQNNLNRLNTVLNRDN